MSVFDYKALTQNGAEVGGTIEAESARAARNLLREQNLSPLLVNAIDEKTTGNSPSHRTRLSRAELALLTRQLATLLSAGMPIAEAVGGVAEQTEKPKAQAMLTTIRARIREGQSFASALAQYPAVFSKMYCATIAAGEQSGHLGPILNRLADHTERQSELKQQVMQAMIYPLLMTVVSIGIVTFLMLSVVPKMIHVFESSGHGLPFLTQVLLFISHSIGQYGLYSAILLLIGSLAFFKYLATSPLFKAVVQQQLMRLPLLGRLINGINTARFLRTLSVLSQAGVPLLESMTISAQLVTLSPIRNRLTTAYARVKEGVSLHAALKESGDFSPMSLHLVATGERSGDLTNLLERAAKNLEQEVESTLKMGLTLFEPMMILVMGGVVLFIVLAILLPIFAMDQFVA